MTLSDRLRRRPPRRITVNLAAVSDVPVYVAAGLLEPFAQDAGGFFDAPPAR